MGLCFSDAYFMGEEITARLLNKYYLYCHTVNRWEILVLVWLDAVVRSSKKDESFLPDLLNNYVNDLTSHPLRMFHFNHIRTKE